jgi:hypothetical protein
MKLLILKKDFFPQVKNLRTAIQFDISEDSDDNHKKKTQFKYQEAPIRNQAQRKLNKGIECEECKKFYDAVDMTSRSTFVCDHSRHRPLYSPPHTPPDFWNLDFPPTQQTVLPSEKSNSNQIIDSNCEVNFDAEFEAENQTPVFSVHNTKKRNLFLNLDNSPIKKKKKNLYNLTITSNSSNNDEINKLGVRDGDRKYIGTSIFNSTDTEFDEDETQDH